MTGGFYAGMLRLPLLLFDAVAMSRSRQSFCSLQQKTGRRGRTSRNA
ncbi:hypothetical protein SAMN05414139_06649 [Burkholderia sp. D7]|nr:hypothetical protein SAMN05414139_06649 [Burkholderia sp. D7]